NRRVAGGGGGLRPGVLRARLPRLGRLAPGGACRGVAASDCRQHRHLLPPQGADPDPSFSTAPPGRAGATLRPGGRRHEPSRPSRAAPPAAEAVRGRDPPLLPRIYEPGDRRRARRFGAHDRAADRGRALRAANSTRGPLVQETDSTFVNAHNQLNAFVNELQADVRTGRLSSAAASSLQAAMGTSNRLFEWWPLAA